MSEWVTVPVEPTEEMVAAACVAINRVSCGDQQPTDDEMKAALRAALAAAPQPAQAPDRIDELRRSVAEIIGCDPETWPEHGNAPLAIAAIVALGEKARERLYGKGQHGGSYRKPDGSLWKVITETDPDAPRKPAERPAQAQGRGHPLAAPPCAAIGPGANPGEPVVKVYISGPMTGIPDFNVPAFNLAAAMLRTKGIEAVNPAEINPDSAMSWEQCMRADIKALCDCDTLAMLPGPRRASGGAPCAPAGHAGGGLRRAGSGVARGSAQGDVHSLPANRRCVRLRCAW